jgi:hypothetical protein
LYEAYFTGIGDQGETHFGMDVISSRQEDKEGLADEILARDYAAGKLNVPISLTGFSPETGIKAGGAVVTQNEEFILFQGNGVSFGTDAWSAIDGVHIVVVPVQGDMFQGKGIPGCG